MKTRPTPSSAAWAIPDCATPAHTTSFRYYLLEGEEYKYNVNINVTHRIWLDAVAQGMTYSPQTGVRTYRPENVNGNWELINNIYMMYKISP